MSKKTNVIENEGILNEEISNEELISEGTKQLCLTRKAFGKSKDGKKIVYDYYVNGKIAITHPVSKAILEKEVKANLRPADVGGYDLIDFIFSIGDTAPLLVKPFEFDGVKGVSYEAAIINPETGEVELSVAMKPNASSDKSILASLLK